MYFFSFQVALSLTIAVLLLLVAMLVSKKQTNFLHKSSPFECGFLPKNFQRQAFSLQFFLISLVFLIFDMEIILLFPLLLKPFSSMMNSVLMLSVFIFILFYGLMLEWSQGTLEWLK